MKQVTHTDKSSLSRPAKVIMLLLGLACIMSVIALVMQGLTPDEDRYIKVLSHHEETILPLDENESYDFVCPEGINVVTVQDGAVWVSYADCPRQKCVDHAPITQAGESIVCLPHQLSVEIVSIHGDGAFDGVAS